MVLLSFGVHTQVVRSHNATTEFSSLSVYLLMRRLDTPHRVCGFVCPTGRSIKPVLELNWDTNKTKYGNENISEVKQHCSPTK